MCILQSNSTLGCENTNPKKKKKKKLWLPQINGKFQINGGQPTENFLKAFRMAASGDV